MTSRSNSGEGPGDGYSVRDRRWWQEGATGDGDSGVATPPTLVARLESDLADRNRRLEEMTSRVRDSERELEQVRNRLERESGREIERRIRDVVGGWLAALDDLDRAIEAGRTSAPGSPLLQGVELAQANLLARLAGQGIRRLVPTGEPFDPRFHEAIGRAEVDDPAREGAVIATVLPGYQIGDDVLRAARVVVGTAPDR